MQKNKILLDCTNHVAGRMLSKIVDIIKKDNKIQFYLINWHLAISTGSLKNAVKKYKYDSDHSTTTHGPYLPHSIRGIFWRKLRGMLPKNKIRKSEIKRNIILLSPYEYLNIKNDKFNFEGKIAAESKKFGKNYTIQEYSRKINGQK